jgi:glutathionylspermidine synthase
VVAAGIARRETLRVIIKLAHYLIGNRPAARLRRLFREYAGIYFEFLNVAERRAVGLATTHTAVEAWKTTFALQRALKKQQVSRVEYLLRDDKSDYLSWRGLNDITGRVDGGWGEADEADLLAISRDYASLSKLIGALQSRFDSKALLENRDIVEQDAQYNKALGRLSARSREMSELFKRAVAKHAA